MEIQIDQTKPGDNWEFDAEVTQVFDNMLQRSIPQYEIMRKACFDIGSKYIEPDYAIVDLGCSRGEALYPFILKYKQANKYIGIEVSKPMYEAARLRFKSIIGIEQNIELYNYDLRNHYPEDKACLTLAILTVQFIPIEYRQRIIQKIYNHTKPGGALIFVEKILGANAELDSIMVDIYYQLKAANGYSEEAIKRKRLSLEGVLVPVTAKWNEELLKMAGFKQVDCFWRWMNFAGWIAIR